MCMLAFSDAACNLNFIARQQCGEDMDMPAM